MGVVIFFSILKNIKKICIDLKISVIHSKEALSQKGMIMGGSSQKTTQKTTLGKTTTANPYVVSKTNNKGTTSNFVQGSAFDTINNFVNSNMNNLLNDYLNPSLNSTTNQALLNNYRTNLNIDSH